MNSSGMKRGLAVAAISALSLAGLAQAAQAQTVGEGQGAFTLYSQYSGGASTRFDGTDQTVTLFAGTPNTIGGVAVNQVQFYYVSNGAETKIGTPVAVANGIATTQWTPPAPPAGDAITSVLARAFAQDGTTQLGATQKRNITGANIPPHQAAPVAGALRSSLGVSPPGTVAINGTTTAAADGTDANVLGPNGTSGQFAPGNGQNLEVVGDPNAQNVRTYQNVVNVGAANNPANNATPNEIVVGLSATNATTGPSDDVNAYTLYNQVVAGAVASNGTPSNVQGNNANTREESVYTVKAVDQNGAPVSGIDLYQSNSAGSKAAGAGKAGSVPGQNQPANPTAADDRYLDANGTASVSLYENTIDTARDQDGNANNRAQTTYYVLDTNNNGTYESGKDYLFTFTQTTYNATATTVTLSSTKGTAIDDDETEDIVVNVKDMNGQNLAGQNVQYNIVRSNVTDNTSSTTPAIGYSTVGPTDANGNVTIPNVGNGGGTNANDQVNITVNAYVNNNGTPVPDTGDAIATPYKLESDRSTVVWDTGTRDQLQAFASKTETGKLALIHTGTPLINRSLAITYAPTIDSYLSPQTAQPTGTTRGSATMANVVTSSTGTFGVSVTDPKPTDSPAGNNGQELNNRLTATNTAYQITGNAATDDVAGLSEVLFIDFLRSLTPTSIAVINPVTGTEADGLQSIYNNGDATDLEPGRLALGYVVAKNADGVQLSDVPVTVNIGQGNFVDATKPYDPTPVPGGTFGEWSNAGKSITVLTADDTADGFFIANIEKNDGFDDDGLVNDKIAATAGGLTDGHDFTWNTIGVPLNPRATDPLVVKLSADQESTKLPSARAGKAAGSGQVVAYDVESYDQFGNRTSQPITVDDNNNPRATINGETAPFNDTSKFSLGEPTLLAAANSATSQTINVQLAGAVTTKYTDNPFTGAFDPTNPPLTVKATADIRKTTDAINWYVLDFAASQFTLGQQGPDSVATGTAVTEVLTATDQMGQTISGLPVGFIRVGPSNDGDSDGNSISLTDFNGKAFYDFAGNLPGVASTTAVIYDDEGVRQFTVGPDTVTFTGPQTGGGNPSTGNPVGATLKLTGSNANGGKQDKVRVQVTSKGDASAAMVRFFRVIDGTLVPKRFDTVGDDGEILFKVTDKNGNKATKYVVKLVGNKNVKSVRANIFQR